MQAPDAVPDLGRDALVSRLCGNYLLFPARAEDRFVACDAIALAELARGSVDWLNEYRAAFRSVTTGLRLRKADAVLALCTGNGMRAPELFAHLGTLEFSAAERLLDTRRAALGLMRVGSGTLLGRDPLLGDPGAKDPPSYQPALRRVHAWWTEERDRMPAGVVVADRALCSLFEWDVLAGIPYERLQQEFGFPDTAAVCDRWLDAF